MLLRGGSMSQNDKEQFPSMGEQSKNLLDLLNNVIEQSMEGNPILVDQLERDRRFDICKACDSFQAKSQRCKECGCYMTHKTQFHAAECPLGKW